MKDYGSNDYTKNGRLLAAFAHRLGKKRSTANPAFVYCMSTVIIFYNSF